MATYNSQDIEKFTVTAVLETVNLSDTNTIADIQWEQSTESGGNNYMIIIMTDGTRYRFPVKNGVKGDPGTTDFNELEHRPTKLSDFTDDLPHDAAPAQSSSRYVSSGAVWAALQSVKPPQELIDDVAAAKAGVKKNAEDISKNTDDIAKNARAITVNTSDIEALKRRKTAEWGNIAGNIDSQLDLAAKLSSIAATAKADTDKAVEDLTVEIAKKQDDRSLGIIAVSPYQQVLGRYNIPDEAGRYALIVGNGTSDDDRCNAFCVTWDGEIVSDDMNSLVRNLGGVSGISAVSDVPEQQENGVLYVITA